VAKDQHARSDEDEQIAHTPCNCRTRESDYSRRSGILLDTIVPLAWACAVRRHARHARNRSLISVEKSLAKAGHSARREWADLQSAQEPVADGAHHVDAGRSNRAEARGLHDAVHHVAVVRRPANKSKSC
jgi:hypothetical protein